MSVNGGTGTPGRMSSSAARDQLLSSREKVVLGERGPGDPPTSPDYRDLRRDAEDALPALRHVDGITALTHCPYCHSRGAVPSGWLGCIVRCHPCGRRILVAQ